jgi:tRNA pseudouridine55 synthase
MQNGFILLDKPSGITSRFAAAKVARMFGTKKFGHVGTLDPMASGLLIIALGEATKMIPYLSGSSEVVASECDKVGWFSPRSVWSEYVSGRKPPRFGALSRDPKEYLFSIKWGTETDTGDITGAVIKSGGRIPTKDEIRAALPKFIGEYEQMPPAFSAKKIDGVPAYKLARKGAEVKLSPKKVTIYELCPATVTDTFRVKCGTGTYVRSLVADMAKALGTIAACSMIRRTKSNGFDIKDAVGLDFLENLYNNGGVAKYLLPLDLGLDDIPVAGLETKDARLFQSGGFVPGSFGEGTVRVYSGDEFIGIGNAENGVLKPKRIVNVD